MHNLIRIFLVALLALAPAQSVLPQSIPSPSSAAPSEGDDQPRLEVDLESTSHVVRQDEDRLNFHYRTDKWDFAGLVASLGPRFREDRDQIGLLVARAFDWGDLVALARRTDKPAGEDMVASVAYSRSSASGAFGAELTWGQADLLDDDFLAGDGEDQFVGRVYWRRANGFEVEVFGAASATFDLMRGTDELLERLPRSEIVGAETLADLYVDEDRLEDSTGVAVAAAGERLSWRAYLKSGEQTLRGLFDGDDMTGFGGELRYASTSRSVDVELDLRQIDPADGFDSFDRGRFLFDFRHHLGELEWGVGGYLQGEAESFSEIPDVYDTAGVGLTASLGRANGSRIGLWVMWEDNAPELQVMTRLGLFHRKAEREYGVGVRREETGSRRFEEETFGPFVFFKTPFRNMVLGGDLGIQDGDAYGKLSLGIKR